MQYSVLSQQVKTVFWTASLAGIINTAVFYTCISLFPKFGLWAIAINVLAWTLPLITCFNPNDVGVRRKLKTSKGMRNLSIIIGIMISNFCTVLVFLKFYLHNN